MAAPPNVRAELYLDAHRTPVQGVFGWKQGTGTHATDKCLLGNFTGTTAKDVTGLTPGGLYQFEFMDDANLLTGTTDKWYFYKPGSPTDTTSATTGNSFPWDTDNGYPLRVRLKADQDRVSFVAANTTKTVRVYGIQLE